MSPEKVAAIVSITVASPLIWRLVRKIINAVNVIFELGAQFKPNGGSSFWDMFTKVRDDVTQIKVGNVERDKVLGEHTEYFREQKDILKCQDRVLEKTDSAVTEIRKTQVETG